MQHIIDFILANKVILAALAVAILDLAFALNQKLDGNGILHQIYLTAKKIAGKDAPPSA